ncbi:MAG: fasciclin domain-containing protein [Chitinophagaceae bacterium]|nr:fasciclin domain-containing protein [Polaromonas sp.]
MRKPEIPVNTPVKTLQDETLNISGAFVITDQRGRIADIVATDMLTSNDVIHVVDKVILPKA